MPKFVSCSRIRKCPVTILTFPYICFDFRSAVETQLTTEKCMVKIQIVTRRFRMRLHA